MPPSTPPEPHPPADVTALLLAWGAGDGNAAERLLPAVYDELRRQAERAMRREGEHTLQATALVHEAYLRLVDQRRVEWRNRAHFFGIAAQMMRRILVDHARERQAAKRLGGAVRVELDDQVATVAAPDVEVLSLDRALDDLAALDPRQAHIVELRYFGGLSEQEVGAVLSLSRATVTREWQSARAWLYRRLTTGTDPLTSAGRPES